MTVTADPRPHVGPGYLVRTGVRRVRERRLAGVEAGHLPPATTVRRLTEHPRVRAVTLRPSARHELPVPPGLRRSDHRAWSWGGGDVPAEVALDVAGAEVAGEDGWVLVDGELVDDLWVDAWYPTRRLAGREPGVGAGAARTDLPGVARLPGTTVNLLTPWAWNYYHFSVQGAPRLGLLEQAGWLEDALAADTWLVPDPRHAWVGQWLDRMGVPVDRRRTLRRGERVAAERLLVTSVPSANRWVPPWVVEWMRRTVDPGTAPASTAGPGRRVFLDREPQDKRRIVNRDEVLAVLAEFDVEVLRTGRLPLRDEAAEVAAADVVVAVIGAASANLAFCRPGTRVVEILPAALVSAATAKLCRSAGLDYALVRGREPSLPWPLRFPDSDADVVVDAELLRRRLREATAAHPPLSRSRA
ncbi:DUF563 domain-containing protein [Kineococcus gynurae]|uniref:DUF563 domain-containing protein n=1 Tax=Kineococcus gynurae TaxID=452979 RepID=A0ABV5LP30_9ACTN